jgi:small subunit ribosomal protein S4
MKLFLKGDRCFTDKCAIERRNYPPGQMYGLVEKQFARTMASATRLRGPTGENLLSLLERRFDNVIFRLGFATSRAEARQLVRHGHFLINGRRASIPSMLLKPGAKVSVREKSQKMTRIAGALEALEGRSVPEWLEIDKDAFEGTVKALPSREDITLPIQEQLIVELYSR